MGVSGVGSGSKTQEVKTEKQTAPVKNNNATATESIANPPTDGNRNSNALNARVTAMELHKKFEVQQTTVQNAQAQTVQFQTVQAQTVQAQTVNAGRKTVDEVVNEVLDSKGSGNSASVLAGNLAGRDAQFRADVMGELARRDAEGFADILRGAGGDWNQEWKQVNGEWRGAQPWERAVIANSLGSAFDAGKLSSDFVNSLVTGKGADAANYIGNLLNQGGSPATNLQTAFANKALETAFGPYGQYGNDKQFVAAAMRAISGNPTAMANVLTPYNSPGGVNGKTLADLTKMTLESRGIFETAYSSLPNAYTGLIKGAARLPQSSQDLALGIFKDAVKNHPREFEGEYNAGRAGALADLFIKHADHIVRSMTNSRALNSDLVGLSRFFESTIYNPNLSQTKIESVKTAVGNVAASIRSTVLQNGQDSESAYMLGTLAGTMFNGFRLRVHDMAADAAQQKKFLTDLVGFAFKFIPYGDLVKKAAGGDRIAEILLNHAADQTKTAAINEVVNFLVDGKKSSESADSVETFVNDYIIGLPNGNEHVEAIEGKRNAMSAIDELLK